MAEFGLKKVNIHPLTDKMKQGIYF
jgi:hypothetical protein